MICVAVLRSLVRAAVFLPGMAFGYLMAVGVASFPGGAPAVVTYTMIFVFLALALAAPVSWFFAELRDAGDRWTLGYVAAWALLFAVLYLAVWLF